MFRLRSHLTFANVVACLALFVALGGSSVAAVSLSKNSVGPKQLKKGAVHNSDLGKNAVTSTKVKNRSLLRRDFKTGQLHAGPRGAQGAPGKTGNPGKNGEPATKLFATVYANGALGYGKGVVDSSGSGGTYHVTFNRPITNCAAVVTVGVGDPTDASVAHYDSGATATAAVGVGPFVGNNSDKVRVITSNAAGTTAAESFHIAVFC